jgi:phage repressor protein C with HTH and peptisase S24 domain
MDTIAKRIKHIRSNVLGLSQAGLAEKLGVTRGAVGNWELGGTVETENLFKLSSLANVQLEWLAKGVGQIPIGKPLRSEEFREASDVELGVASPPPLPVFSAAEGGPGIMVVSSDPIDFVDRPWFLRYAADSFAVLIVGDSMEPAYEAGEMALVNKRLPPMRGKDAIFVSAVDGGDFRATIKRFVKATEHEFIVEQFNPRKELRLTRTKWNAAFRVVGKYSG